MPEIVMPRLSDSMEEGTVLSWKVAVGDQVAVGQEIVEIETDKANMGYEADVAGTVTEIVVAAGESAPVGALIAKIGDPNGRPEAPPPPPAPTARPAAAAPSSSRPARISASPLARRIAQDRGVDLSDVVGTGPGGRIVKADVEAAEAPGRESVGAAPVGSPSTPETAKGSVEIVELTKLQQVVSRRMSESKATAPHFYLQTEIDMSAMVDARARLRALSPDGGVVPSLNDAVVKACAIALREHPLANGAYKDGRLELYSRVNVGVAVAAEDALVVPVVFDADKRGLREIAGDTRSLAAKVRDGSITPPDLAGGTFTVSNLGMFGVTSFAAVINPGQAAILAVGAVAERPVVRDGAIVTGQIMNVTLACDHRILYGAPAAEFLARVRALLEEPLALSL